MKIIGFFEYNMLKTIKEYKESFDYINDNFIESDDLSFLYNEKEKISNAFTYSIIERCDSSEVYSLRKFIEEYEREVYNILNVEHKVNDRIKKKTVFIDLLFGIDISYFTTFRKMFDKDHDFNYYFTEYLHKKHDVIKHNKINDSSDDEGKIRV